MLRSTFAFCIFFPPRNNNNVDILQVWTESPFNRLLQSKSDLHRWFQITMMQTLKRRSNRWASAHLSLSKTVVSISLLKNFLHFTQLIDITGKDQDESMIALHDCNGDVNRAINVLLEGSPDTVSIHFVFLRAGSREIFAILPYLVIKTVS